MNKTVIIMTLIVIIIFWYVLERMFKKDSFLYSPNSNTIEGMRIV